MKRWNHQGLNNSVVPERRKAILFLKDSTRNNSLDFTTAKKVKALNYKVQLVPGKDPLWPKFVTIFAKRKKHSIQFWVIWLCIFMCFNSIDFK